MPSGLQLEERTQEVEVKLSKKLEDHRIELRTLSEQIQTIENLDDYNTTIFTIKALKDYQNQVKEFFAETKASAKETYDKIREQEKSFTEWAENCEDRLRSIVMDYATEFTIERENERQEATEESDKRLKDMGLSPIQKPTNWVNPLKVDGVSFVEVWDWDVEDVTQIPDRYFKLDTKAIDREVKEKGALVSKAIPGIRVAKRQSLRVRSK
jgi:hypothetical protein